MSKVLAAKRQAVAPVEGDQEKVESGDPEDEEEIEAYDGEIHTDTLYKGVDTLLGIKEELKGICGVFHHILKRGPYVGRQAQTMPTWISVALNVASVPLSYAGSRESATMISE